MSFCILAITDLGPSSPFPAVTTKKKVWQKNALLFDARVSRLPRRARRMNAFGAARLRYQ